MYGAAILTNPAPGWSFRVAEEVLPGAAIIAFGNDFVGIEGRLADLEVRDTFVVLAPRAFCFAFFFRKPLSEPTVTDQLSATSTGAVAIDECRVHPVSGDDYGRSSRNAKGTNNAHQGFKGKAFKIKERHEDYAHSDGRWPPNLLLMHGQDCGTVCTSDCPVKLLDTQSGELTSGMMVPGQKRVQTNGAGGYHGGFDETASLRGSYGDTGGASRFFPQFYNESEVLDWFRTLVLPPGLTLYEGT
jgi:hypothetical protein